MKRTIKHSDGREETQEGTAEELAVFERSLHAVLIQPFPTAHQVHCPTCWKTNCPGGSGCAPWWDPVLMPGGVTYKTEG